MKKAFKTTEAVNAVMRQVREDLGDVVIYGMTLSLCEPADNVKKDGSIRSFCIAEYEVLTAEAYCERSDNHCYIVTIHEGKVVAEQVF